MPRDGAFEIQPLFEKDGYLFDIGVFDVLHIRPVHQKLKCFHFLRLFFKVSIYLHGIVFPYVLALDFSVRYLDFGSDQKVLILSRLICLLGGLWELTQKRINKNI
jgi:hypothetical protein